MKQYIDREALIAEYDRVHQGPEGGARKLMVDAPAADVVEVVRCKDCKYYNLYHLACVYPRHNGNINVDGFCSYGERKEQK